MLELTRVLLHGRVRLDLLFGFQIHFLCWSASKIKPGIRGHWGLLLRMLEVELKITWVSQPKILRKVLWCSKHVDDVCFWQVLPFPSWFCSISWKPKTCLLRSQHLLAVLWWLTPSPTPLCAAVARIPVPSQRSVLLSPLK